MTRTKKVTEFIRHYQLPILSGLLIGTSYIPFPPWALFFCLVPLFVFWMRTKTAKEAFIGGWVTQFILNLIGFHWISYTAVEFGHFPWWAGLLTLLGFASIAHLYYPIAGFLLLRLKGRLGLTPLASLFGVALLFALGDRLYPSIFPWHLGYPWLWTRLPGFQVSDVIGFEGLNYFTILINALLAWAWLVRPQKFSWNSNSAKIAGNAMILLIAINVAGFGRETKWQQTDSELDVLFVQGNIGNFEKLIVEKKRDFGIPIVEKYLELSKDGLSKNPGTELIIWPETAFPQRLDRSFLFEPLQKRVREFAQTEKVALLTGAYSTDVPTWKTYNGLFYVSSNAIELPEPPYRKSILLVFGETFPFSDVIPYMDKFFPNMGSFAKGQGPTTMKVRVGKDDQRREVFVGPQICYEGLYPWFSAGLAQKGAQIFVNVTNDSWFGYPFEPYQHLYMTLARAVEFRRPLLRATNTGITAAVLASGEVLPFSPVGEEWTGFYKIPFQTNPEHTLYEKFGFVWPWVLAFALILLLVFGRGRTQRT